MAGTEQPGSWTTNQLLQLLGGMGLKAGGEFTAAQVRRRCVHDKGSWLRGALRTGKRAGYFTIERRLDANTGGTAGHYTITAAGARAIAAAARGETIRSGPKGPLATARKRPAATFNARLWALLRARRVIDGGSAAETLVDAGEDVTAAARTAAIYLQRWADAGALQECEQRLPRGRKRFVLIKDSPEPPVWTAKDRARHRAGAAADPKS